MSAPPVTHQLRHSGERIRGGEFWLAEDRPPKAAVTRVFFNTGLVYLIRLEK